MADTAEVGRRDERIKCAVFLDGTIFMGSSIELRNEGLQKPFLAVNQTNETFSCCNLLQDAQRLFDLSTRDATLLRVQGASHATSSLQDWAWIGENTPQSRRASLAISACVLSFFDRKLKGAQTPFPPAEFADVLFDMKTK